jgi:hypothetical protein
VVPVSHSHRSSPPARRTNGENAPPRRGYNGRAEAQRDRPLTLSHHLWPVRPIAVMFASAVRTRGLEQPPTQVFTRAFGLAGGRAAFRHCHRLSAASRGERRRPAARVLGACRWRRPGWMVTGRSARPPVETGLGAGRRPVVGRAGCWRGTAGESGATLAGDSPQRGAMRQGWRVGHRAGWRFAALVQPQSASFDVGRCESGKLAHIGQPTGMHRPASVLKSLIEDPCGREPLTVVDQPYAAPAQRRPLRQGADDGGRSALRSACPGLGHRPEPVERRTGLRFGAPGVPARHGRRIRRSASRRLVAPGCQCGLAGELTLVDAGRANHPTPDRPPGHIDQRLRRTP